MTYELEYTDAAKKDLRKLHPEVRRRVLTAAEKLREDPRPDGVDKLSGSSMSYRIRVGDYRILYTVDDDKVLVEVFRVASRGSVYKSI